MLPKNLGVADEALGNNLIMSVSLSNHIQIITLSENASLADDLKSNMPSADRIR